MGMTGYMARQATTRFKVTLATTISAEDREKIFCKVKRETTLSWETLMMTNCKGVGGAIR